MSNTNNSAAEQSRGRKNPLGFIVDFFRPKKAKSTHIEETPVTWNEAENSNSSTSGYNINAAKGINHNKNRMGAGSPEFTEGGEGRLSTPRRQKESDVLKSMEKLHVSREDNPLRQKKTPQHPMTLAISPESGEDLDHSMLIRSPPPIIKRDESVSPTPGTHGGGVWGRDHARLEEDAAQILALQRNENRVFNYGSTTSLTTSKSFTPLPAISPRVSYYSCIFYSGCSMSNVFHFEVNMPNLMLFYRERKRGTV